MLWISPFTGKSFLHWNLYHEKHQKIWKKLYFEKKYFDFKHHFVFFLSFTSFTLFIDALIWCLSKLEFPYVLHVFLLLLLLYFSVLFLFLSPSPPPPLMWVLHCYWHGQQSLLLKHSICHGWSVLAHGLLNTGNHS